ncbi:protein tyrosine phosphatase receptor type C-associated protein [Cuculus canorus]|uniref:protein tyrosine phosphatase receptor type C-associated protein n=1 Tax=Cuculus canorus TaxID=55661 RepID=UPI0023AA2A68|nr:protein tyrosine phosphatase receptor type C-associated protein [Cuculus canorus]
MAAVLRWCPVLVLALAGLVMADEPAGGGSDRTVGALVGLLLCLAVGLAIAWRHLCRLAPGRYQPRPWGRRALASLRGRWHLLRGRGQLDVLGHGDSNAWGDTVVASPGDEEEELMPWSQERRMEKEEEEDGMEEEEEEDVVVASPEDEEEELMSWSPDQQMEKDGMEKDGMEKDGMEKDGMEKKEDGMERKVGLEKMKDGMEKKKEEAEAEAGGHSSGGSAEVLLSDLHAFSGTAVWGDTRPQLTAL